MPTSVALGPRFETFVKEQIASGRYNNVSEVLRAGLRLLEDQEKLKAAKLEELRGLIQEGLDSGVSDVDHDEFFDRLEAKYRAMIPPSNAG